MAIIIDHVIGKNIVFIFKYTISFKNNNDGSVNLAV